MQTNYFLDKVAAKYFYDHIKCMRQVSMVDTKVDNFISQNTKFIYFQLKFIWRK
jgi:hypothetical protein